MTPAELAKYSAISFECKKDALQQRQSGDWKISFTVQGVDMDERITRAAMGTRFIAALVEIDDLEMPVSKPSEKEIKQNPSSEKEPATPQLAALDKSQPVGAKREEIEPLSEKGPATRYAEVAAKREKMDWRELQPAAQAGIRCADPVFRKFLEEQYHFDVEDIDEEFHTEMAAEFVRSFCNVASRSELGTNAKARVIWHQLDSQFLAWKSVS